MKVLVTGAGGQVGLELQDLVSPLDCDLYALDRKSLDITNTKNITEQVMKYNPDIIINAAAYTSVDFAEKESSEANAVNCIGVGNLADICKKFSIMLIHISSDYVFSGSKKESYLEEDPVDPINVYGVTKWNGEQAIRSVLAEHIILRTSWVFGIHGKNFVKTIIKLAQEQQALKVVNDQFGCPTSAKALAQTIFDICLLYCSQKKLEYGTYHYSGMPTTSWYLFAKKIIKIATEKNLVESTITIEPISSKEYISPSQRPKNTTLSSKKIQKVFDIIPISWAKDLEHTISHLK